MVRWTKYAISPAKDFASGKHKLCFSKAFNVTMILTVINIVIRLNGFTDNGSISSRVCKQFILYRLRGFATRKYVRFSWENFAFQLDVHVFKTSMSSKALISPSIGGLFKAVVSVGYAIIIHNYRLMLLRADLSDTRSEHAIPFAVLVDFYNQTDCEAMQVNRMFDFDTTTTTQTQRDTDWILDTGGLPCIL